VGKFITYIGIFIAVIALKTGLKIIKKPVHYVENKSKDQEEFMDVVRAN
jgi:hypothetical protein